MINNTPNKYKIIFENDIPTWNDLSIKDESCIGLSFANINIIMNVYEDTSIIYASRFYIKGYYWCNTNNFEFDKIEFHIIKDNDEKTRHLISDQIEKDHENIENMFNNTVLDIKKTDIYEYINESLW